MCLESGSSRQLVRLEGEKKGGEEREKRKGKEWQYAKKTNQLKKWKERGMDVVVTWGCMVFMHGHVPLDE